MVDHTTSLASFLDGGGDISSIPNLREIVRHIIEFRAEYSGPELRSMVEQYDAEADSLEPGIDYELRLWNIAHWLTYEVVPATADNARYARSTSDALGDPALADRLFALLPPRELAEIRRQAARPGTM
jgi:hypothetical protein